MTDLAQDDDVKVSITPPEAEASNGAMGFVDAYINGATAVAVMDMQVCPSERRRKGTIGGRRALNEEAVGEY